MAAVDSGEQQRPLLDAAGAAPMTQDDMAAFMQAVNRRLQEPRGISTTLLVLAIISGNFLGVLLPRPVQRMLETRDGRARPLHWALLAAVVLVSVTFAHTTQFLGYVRVVVESVVFTFLIMQLRTTRQFMAAVAMLLALYGMLMWEHYEQGRVMDALAQTPPEPGHVAVARAALATASTVNAVATVVVVGVLLIMVMVPVAGKAPTAHRA